MPKVNNLRYKEFIEKGTIQLFSMDELEAGLAKAKNSKYGRLGMNYCITQYYTGGRPVEILQLKPKHFEKKGKYLNIQIPTAKRGVARLISLPFARKHVSELWKYSQSVYDDVYLFYDLVSSKQRTYINKKGVVKRYTIITDKVYYNITKWFDMNPYFFRHSRMSSLSQNGATMEELRQFKGAKRYDSIYPYLHMSSDISQKIGNRIK